MIVVLRPVLPPPMITTSQLEFKRSWEVNIRGSGCLRESANLTRRRGIDDASLRDCSAEDAISRAAVLSRTGYPQARAPDHRCHTVYWQARDLRGKNSPAVPGCRAAEQGRFHASNTSTPLTWILNQRWAGGGPPRGTDRMLNMSRPARCRAARIV